MAEPHNIQHHLPTPLPFRNSAPSWNFSLPLSGIQACLLYGRFLQKESLGDSSIRDREWHTQRSLSSLPIREPSPQLKQMVIKPKVGEREVHKSTALC